MGSIKRSLVLALLLAGCNGSDYGKVAAPPISATPTPSPTPSPSPSPTPPAIPVGLTWYLDGDSYGLGAFATGISAGLGGASIEMDPVGGSDMLAIRDRVITKNAQWHDNPLIIWDGSPNGHVNGSISMEMGVVDDIAAFKGDRKNWLIVASISVFPGPGMPPSIDPIVADMVQFRDAIASKYGASHVFDPLPIINSFSDGSPEDQADIAAGFPPRSTLADGLHLRDDVKIAVANALTAPDGPMAKIRAEYP